MSNLSRFMKQNKKVRENTFFAATKSLLDENGQPMLWEIRPISTREDETIRDSCTLEVPVKGKPNLYRPKLNTSEYLAKMLTASIVEPDLLDASLQDSYHVTSAEDLLREMLDEPAEFNALGVFVQNFNGFNTSIDEKSDEVKN